MKKTTIELLSLLMVAVILVSCTVPALMQSAAGIADTSAPTVQRELVGSDTKWRYLYGEEPGRGWTVPDFDDSGWIEGAGSFGAKDGVLADVGTYSPKTLLPMKKDGVAIGAYFFRTEFNVTDPAALPVLEGTLVYDDAVIVYINDKVVFEGNLPKDGFDGASSFGAKVVMDEPRNESFRVRADMLVPGYNTLAVELHQAAQSSTDVYFEFVGLSQYDLETDVSGLCLFAGEDSSLTARWYGDCDEMSLCWSTAGAQAVEVSAHHDGGRYSAAMTGLKPDTEYAYHIKNEWGCTRNYSFKTPATDGFDVLLLGDPQLTGSKWASALEHAVGVFNDCSLALATGDLIDDADDDEQYRMFVDMPLFRTLPLAAVRGNHENAVLYDKYFAPEAVSASGRDYCISYGDVLFICIDSNDKVSHEAFLRQSIGKDDWKWVIVMMHHSLFGLGKYADNEFVVALRNELAPLFSELDVDLVLSGHNHIYSRTMLMEGVKPAGNMTEKSVGQTIYICAGSSTGSKYYDRSDGDTDGGEFAATAQQKRPVVTRIRISEDALDIKTLYADDGSTADEIILTRKRASRRITHAEHGTQYLLSTGLPDGALAVYPAAEGKNSIIPYFSDGIATALLMAGEVGTVMDYLDWHFLHLNHAEDDVNGLAYTIYDYTVMLKGEDIVSEKATGSYDSTDSYAATFLSLLLDYYLATGDAEYIRKNYDLICGITWVLLSTASDGLTPARPDYKMYYLMDNCEVWKALGDSAELLTRAVLPALSGKDADNCRTLCSMLLALKGQMAQAIEERMYNAAEGRYEYALDANGSPALFDGGQFYPDNAAQLWPVICGLLEPDSERSKMLYFDLSERWNWESIGLPGGCWGAVAYCAALMGDGERLQKFLTAYHSFEETVSGADAAWVALARAEHLKR